MRHEHYNDLFRLILLVLDFEKEKKREKHVTWLKLDIREIYESYSWHIQNYGYTIWATPSSKRNDAREENFWIFQLTSIDCIGKKIDRQNDQTNFWFIFILYTLPSPAFALTVFTYIYVLRVC